MISSTFLPLRWCGVVLAALCLSLVGCSANVVSDSPLAGGQLRGNLHGGQQPLSGASVQLYAVGTTGYGSSANPLLSSPVLSDANGNFTITGGYTCPSSTSQLYIVATGGNPGLAPGTNNTAIALMTALGPCILHGGQYTLDPNSFISINEVTTVASVYALAPFMGGDATHVGTGNTNPVGIANAIGIVNNLVDTTAGMALTTTFAGNGTAPQSELNTLGNILASCVNSNGTGTPCSSLFGATTPSGGTAPTDTVQAVLNIARNPANNASALYALASATPPFQPILPSAPNDWTVQLRYKTVQFDSNGHGPTQMAIAIDGFGNAWIANQFTTSLNTASSVAELSNNGSILSGNAGYTGGGLNNPTGIAIDPTGNAWIMNSTNPSLTKLSSTGSPLSGATGFASLLSRGIGIDGFGNVWCGGLAKFDNSGTKLSGGGYTGGGIGAGDPIGGIAIDAAGNAWLAVTTGVGTSTVAKFSSIGVALSGASGYTTSGLSAAWSIAIDNAGNAWVTNNGPIPSVFKLANDGTMLSGSGGFTGGGIANPLGVAIDGGGNVWVTSDQTVTIGGTATTVSSLVELNNSGTILSGGTGYSLSQSGLLGYPVGVAVDGSGNVWTAMSSNYVVEVVGAATPVVTPLSLGVKNNTLGVRP